MRVPEHTPRRWKGAAAAGLLGALTLALLTWVVVSPASHVQAATYTVNAADDSDDGTCDAGHCSLREAIAAANINAAEDNVIAIGVPGPIVLGAPLPTITDDDLIITGSGERVSLPVAAHVFEIGAHGVQISNLILDGENTGIRGVEINAAMDDVILEGLTVRDFTSEGIITSIPGGNHRTAVRGSTVTANGGNGVVLRGDDVTIQDCTITNNGNNGLEVHVADGFVAQGNTFSGNANTQILITNIGAGQNVSLFRNTIISSSDGIIVTNTVNAAAAIDIGLSVANRNVFRGSITPAEQHLKNLSPAPINAIYNDWDAYTPAAIEGVICHNGEAGCGAGIVDFDPFVDTPSPLETPTPTPTATQTPGGETPTPTATPEGGAPPGDVETLPLIAGCNPLAWTGSDGTAIATIDAAVAPPDILVAIWQFEGGIWLGYSPQFPDVSDLTQADRLDVVFLCTSAAGTFSRPVI